MFSDFAIKNSEFLFDRVADYYTLGLKEYNFHANHIALGLKSPKAISSGQSVNVAPSE